MVAGGIKSYYHTNNLYSISAMSDTGGAVIERYTYNPYGHATILAPDGVTIRTVSAVDNPWMTTGRRRDGETGLMFYRTRYEDVELGRFLNRMPWYHLVGVSLGRREGIISNFAMGLIPEPLYSEFYKELRQSSFSYFQGRYNLYDFCQSAPTTHTEPFSYSSLNNSEAAAMAAEEAAAAAEQANAAFKASQAAWQGVAQSQRILIQQWLGSGIAGATACSKLAPEGLSKETILIYMQLISQNLARGVVDTGVVAKRLEALQNALNALNGK